LRIRRLCPRVSRLSRPPIFFLPASPPAPFRHSLVRSGVWDPFRVTPRVYRASHIAVVVKNSVVPGPTRGFHGLKVYPNSPTPSLINICPLYGVSVDRPISRLAVNLGHDLPFLFLDGRAPLSFCRLLFFLGSQVFSVFPHGSYILFQNTPLPWSCLLRWPPVPVFLRPPRHREDLWWRIFLLRPRQMGFFWPCPVFPKARAIRRLQGISVTNLSPGFPFPHWEAFEPDPARRVGSWARFFIAHFSG